MRLIVDFQFRTNSLEDVLGKSRRKEQEGGKLLVQVSSQSLAALFQTLLTLVANFILLQKFSTNLLSKQIQMRTKVFMKISMYKL